MTVGAISALPRRFLGIPALPATLQVAREPILPLVLDGVTFQIGGRRILEGIDLSFGAGGLTVLLGPNGAGKSVLLRLINGLLTPTSGHIRWAGRPAGDPAVRMRQSLVFQRPVLLRRSVLANVAFVLRLRGVRDVNRRALAALERGGLGALARQPARLLSGGEQQRLALVRALASEPDVLLLDEPTASLDPASVAAIETMIRDAVSLGTRAILVTHDVAQARRLGDDVVFLSQGRIAERAGGGAFFDDPRSEAAKAYLAGRLFL